MTPGPAAGLPTAHRRPYATCARARGRARRTERLIERLCHLRVRPAVNETARPPGRGDAPSP
ncbi:hypothetical protein CRI70_05015 [Streptomyces sp. Ru87]|nr:hypothetical protein CRI70_05015 [Streptomyces sp. Ru87]